jgi:murein DD-endopeptidase MepM/ murein hydrolase activator NlpD
MNLREKLSVAVLLVATASSSAFAVTAVSPVCSTSATILSMTYYQCTSGVHTALDISATCGDPIRAPFKGSYYYRYYGGCANSCTGGLSCNGGAGNYYVVTGSSGWDFRLLHINADVNSGSKTCDSCVLGKVGASGSGTSPHVHLDNRQYGTRHSSWYTGTGLTCGSKVPCGTVIGYPTL